MTAIDLETMERARAKKARKLLRYTDTPAARTRRAEMEKEFERGEPYAWPAVEVEIVAETALIETTAA